MNFLDLLYCLSPHTIFECLECLWRSSELDSRQKPAREQIHTEKLIWIVWTVMQVLLTYDMALGAYCLLN